MRKWSIIYKCIIKNLILVSVVACVVEEKLYDFFLSLCPSLEGVWACAYICVYVYCVPCGNESQAKSGVFCAAGGLAVRGSPRMMR